MYVLETVPDKTLPEQEASLCKGIILDVEAKGALFGMNLVKKNKKTLAVMGLQSNFTERFGTQ